MIRLRYLICAGAVALAACAPAAAGWTQPIREWHYDSDGANVHQVMIRQLGTTTDTADDTLPLTFTSANGTKVEGQTSKWITLDLSRKIPKRAKVVALGIKMVISKVEGGTPTDIYVFGRRPGSKCCLGPPGHRDQPVDWSVPGNMGHVGMIGHAVAAHQGDGVRTFSSAVIPVTDGKVQIAWGYRRMPTDGIAFALYLNGWGG